MNGGSHGGQVFAVARRRGVPVEQVLDFSASINPLGMPQEVRRAVMSALDQVVHYPDSEAFELREELARFHGLSPEQIVVGNGSTEFIGLLPSLLPAAVHKRALIIAPAFSEYARALGLAGWNCDNYLLSPDDGFALHPEKISSRLLDGYSLLVLANPANPTGRLYSREEIRLIVDAAERHGVMTLLDEAFIDFCPGGSSLSLVNSSERIVILRSMTKFYAIPGLRLGYAVAGEKLAPMIAYRREPWSVNTLAQAAGRAALHAEEYRSETIRFIGEAKELLSAALEKIPALQLFPGGANYLLCRVRTAVTGTELAERLEKHLLLIRSCGEFPGLGENYFRVAVRSPEENRRLAEALAEMLE